MAHRVKLVNSSLTLRLAGLNILTVLPVKKTPLYKCRDTAAAKPQSTLATEVPLPAGVAGVAFREASIIRIFRAWARTTSLLVLAPRGAVNMVWNNNITGGQNPAFSQEIPSRLRDNLIETFIQNRDKCCFDLHVGRFIASLARPPTDPRAPHPALVQSILLMGCYFSRSPALADYEVRFLAQSRQELSVSLAAADKLHDYVRASNLVAFFYFSKGMYAEAYQQINHSATMVVSCRLHQIASSVWRPASHPEDPEQFLLHPVDNVDLGERIHTFWQTVTLDKVIAMVVGHPSHLPNGPHVDPAYLIKTPWPRLIQEYESGNVSDTENNSVSHLFDTRLARFIRPETLCGLRTQGLCIAHFAFHLSHTSAMPQDATLLDNAICTFINILPGLRNGGESGEIAPTPGLSPVNHNLVLIRTLPYLAHLILFQHGADPIARQRVGVATQGIVATISELSDGDYAELFLGLGVSVLFDRFMEEAPDKDLQHLWFIACEILTNIFHHSNGPVRDQIHRDLNTVLRALRKLSLVYPLLGFQVQELEQKLAAGPQA